MPDLTIHSVGTLAPIVRGAHVSRQYVIVAVALPTLAWGNVRLFDAAAAQWIGSELQRIASGEGGTR